MDVGDVFSLLRRCGQADLGGAREVVQDFTPSRVFCSAAPVALVDDDQIEEIRRELLVDVFLFLVTGDGLIQRQVDFVGFVYLALLDLGHRPGERLEVVGLGLVDKDVAVGQK